MTSRERIQRALEHQQPDYVPLDFGGTALTSMHVTTVYRLRQALGLDAPGTPVKVVEPYQMLGEIKTDLVEATGSDCISLPASHNFYGFPNADWKPWEMFDGTPVLVPGNFNIEPDENGDILQYPQGDRSVPPSGRLPKGGFYFDAVVRQPPGDEESMLNLDDNTEAYQLSTEENFKKLAETIDTLYRNTDKAIVGGVANTSFGDIAHVPGVGLKHPKGIRNLEDWYMFTISRPDVISRIFERQCEIGIRNMEMAHKHIGDRFVAVITTGTDFGTQHGAFMSVQHYRDLFKPFHKQVNAWIHKNTNWKSFIHSCGSVYDFIPDFIDAGFDILNPVQCSAAKMDASTLKREFGDQVTFWGGGIDTQKTLPFGTPDQVRKEVRERIETFGPGGGFVFAAVHNIQARTPPENLVAMFETIRDCREKGIGS